MACGPPWTYGCDTSTRRLLMSTASQPHVTPQRDRGGPAQPLLTVTNLRKHFPVRGGLFNRTAGHIQAIDNVSFSVMKGETLGIVGESVCSKWTWAAFIYHIYT